MSERPAADYLRRLSALIGCGGIDAALELSCEAVSLFPSDEPVLRARAVVLRRAGLVTEAAAFLTGVLTDFPNAAWAHAQAGTTLQHRDGQLAIGHFRRALCLDPAALDYRLALVQALARTGDGDDLEEAYNLLRPALSGAADWPQNDLHIAYEVLQRVCAYDERDALGDPLDLGLKWADAGNHTALFLLLNQATSAPQRAALVALHQIAVAKMEDAAADAPLWGLEDGLVN
jgi:predicted Zn-dependent protease